MKTANQLAKTILDQMGGQRRLTSMTGAHTFVAHPKGVSFKFPRPASGKPNYVKITLAGDDTYTMEFGSIHGLKYKKLKVFPNVYNDQLGDIFKKMTGLYLKLAQENEMLTPQDYKRLLTAGLMNLAAHGELIDGKNGYISFIKPLTRSGLGGTPASDITGLGKILDKQAKEFVAYLANNSAGIISGRVHQNSQVGKDRQTGEVIMYSLSDIYSKGHLGVDRLKALVVDAANKTGMQTFVKVK